ncbi:MAG: peptidoglycan DD-metalloendopeptidase family protein [Clostridia bacterium]|nr:peptidoglycan DD-metalloendopeptidase family protein [Clostridia bacterium]
MKIKTGSSLTVGGRVIAVLLTLTMIMCTIPYTPVIPYVSAEDAEIQQMQDELAVLDQQKNEILDKLSNLSAEEKQTEAYRQSLLALIDTVEDKIATSTALIETLKEKQVEIEKSIADMEAKIADIKEKIKERMRANHEAGAENYFTILIGAEDLGDFLSRVDRVNTLIKYESQLIEDYEKEQANLEQQRKDLIASRELQEKTLAGLEKDREESLALVAEAEAYINSLESDQSKYESEYQAALEAEAALDQEIERILIERERKRQEELLAQQNKPPQGGETPPVQQPTATGEFMWPLPTNVGYISCHFGGSDPNGAPHWAVDIARVTTSTPIYASNDGYVVTASWHYSYGYYVLIDHGNGYATLYAHCSSLTVSSGQNVTKGQTIAYCGSTGFSTGNHLHFEFRVNGQKKNACDYMACPIS